MRTLQDLLNQTRRLMSPSHSGGPTDAQLLARFQAGDDSAFELLVWRHGPIVLNVCRRMLNDEHAAEDAFQTAFLELAMKSSSIGRGNAVGAWLYRVAYRTALRARTRAARRTERERVAGMARAERTARDPSFGLAWEELRPQLETEIARLPVEFRTTFILCHLEGKTNEEAAHELGCPVGTVQSRLSRARARLRTRLRKQGLEPESIPFLFFIQWPQPAPDVPPALGYATVHKAMQAVTDKAVGAAAVRTPARRAARRFRRAALIVLLLLLLFSSFAIAAVLAYSGGQEQPFVAPPPASSSASETPTVAGSRAACHCQH